MSCLDGDDLTQDGTDDMGNAMSRRRNNVWEDEMEEQEEMEW